MHDSHRHDHHKPLRPVIPERKFDYQFILLNDDKPVGCIKGYSKDEDGNIDEVIVYICGMKNTFHIQTKITKHEMKDFLNLAMSPIFTETFFGAMIYMAGFNAGRQLFCSLSNEQKDTVSSTWNDEMNNLDDEEDFNLDIYPDKNEDDNEKSFIHLLREREGQENDKNNDSLDKPNDCRDDADDVLDEIQLPEKEEFIHKPVYQPLVRLYMEDKEYGVLLDIDITGFIDVHKHHHHHHKPKRYEFDENPEDDMIQEDNEDDGIDHTVQKMYM